MPDGLLETQIQQEQFIQRGLGTSPVAARTFAQRDISRLKGLRGELLESQTRAEAERRARGIQTIQQVLRTRRPVGGGGGVAGFDPNRPVAFLNVEPGGRASLQLPGARGGTGALTTEQFGTVSQALGFLEEARRQGTLQGVQVVIPGVPEGISRRELEQARSLGVRQIGRGAGVQAFRRETAPSGTTLSGLGRSLSQIARSRIAQTSRAVPPKPDQSLEQGVVAIKAGKAVDRNIQARIIGSGFRQLGILKTSANEVEAGLFKGFQQAIKRNEGGSFVLQLIRSGALTI